MALPRVLSDHKPILLECGDWEATPSYFKFENMWLQVVGFLEMVRNWWQSYQVMRTPDFILTQKLRHLKGTSQHGIGRYMVKWTGKKSGSCGLEYNRAGNRDKSAQSG